MKLIVGLGNPGKKYRETKHNIGFMCVDAYAHKHNLSLTFDKKFHGDIVKTQTYILLKPHTYMNLSGISIQAVVDYYDIEIDNILIIHDDLDLPTAKIRLRYQGSAGGHNGLKSIIGSLQTDAFKRVKIGIDNQSNIDTKDYVLGKFVKKDIVDIEISIQHTLDIIDLFIKDIPYTDIMNKYNGLMLT